MELSLPSSKYKESFIQTVEEYQAEESYQRTADIYKLDKDVLRNTFDSYVELLLSKSRGENLPVGYVPQTEYWLIDTNEVIGRVSIRHSLTQHLLETGGHIGYDIRPSKRNMGYGTTILKLALTKCRELGINKVLITCDDTNLGSKKIIESNGGILENKVKNDDNITFTLRYWINV